MCRIYDDVLYLMYVRGGLRWKLLGCDLGCSPPEFFPCTRSYHAAHATTLTTQIMPSPSTSTSLARKVARPKVVTSCASGLNPSITPGSFSAQRAPRSSRAPAFLVALPSPPARIAPWSRCRALTAPAGGPQRGFQSPAR